MQSTAERQFQLGLKYFNGDEVEQDYKKAVELWKLAAKPGFFSKGHAGAQNHLGICYELGKGVEKNEKRAVELYQLAISQCPARKQYHSELCYLNGIKKADQKPEGNKPGSKSKSKLPLIGPDAIKKVGTFLSDFDLAQWCKTTQDSNRPCKSDITERKWVREALLPHVFNGNPQGIDAFFKSSADAHPKLLLTKASFHEGYFSVKLKQFICFRRWRGVSPLQAAYLCGDKFIARKILGYIIKDNKLTDHYKKRLLEEARQQLQELINRIVLNKQRINVDPNATGETEAKTTAEVICFIKSSVAVTTANASASGVAAAININENIDSKEQAEQKGREEKFATEFADLSQFLAPLKELVKAYNSYILQYDSLASQNKWAEIDTLWEHVGECQKRLPYYVKQEFFGATPFNPLSEFNSEPNRGVCRYWNNELLDLDKLGFDTVGGLYKAMSARWRAAFPGSRRRAFVVLRCRAQSDLAAINRLCQLRETDLINTFDRLQSLDFVLDLINDNKTTQNKIV